MRFPQLSSSGVSKANYRSLHENSGKSVPKSTRIPHSFIRISILSATHVVDHVHMFALVESLSSIESLLRSFHMSTEEDARILVTFDVDGTLVRSVGSTGAERNRWHHLAFAAGMKEVFNIDDADVTKVGLGRGVCWGA